MFIPEVGAGPRDCEAECSSSLLGWAFFRCPAELTLDVVKLNAEIACGASTMQGKALRGSRRPPETLGSEMFRNASILTVIKRR